MHDEKLLGQAEPASLGACLVGVRPGQELPLDVVVEALVLQAPNVACQPGSDPFVGMPEVVSVVVVPELPGGGGHANVPLLGLASGEDVGLVDDLVVFTPGSIPIYIYKKYFLSCDPKMHTALLEALSPKEELSAQSLGGNNTICCFR